MAWREKPSATPVAMAASKLYTLIRPTRRERTSILPCGVSAMNSRPEKPRENFFAVTCAPAVEAVGDRPARQTRQALAVCVVHVDDASVRRARAGAFKQPALGGEVVLKAVVKIEMVAGEIGEDGGGEVAAPEPIERQRVRTGLEHGVRAAGADDVGEKTLQVQGFRSGGRGRTSSLRCAIGDGAEEPALVAGRAHDRIDQKTGGGLAVGAGDADQLRASPRAGRKNSRRSMASALRASGTRIQTTPGGIAGGLEAALAAAAPVSENSASHAGPGGGGNSLTIALAPRSMALEMKRLPLVISPSMATNSEPGVTRRLS